MSPSLPCAALVALLQAIGGASYGPLQPPSKPVYKPPPGVGHEALANANVVALADVFGAPEGNPLSDWWSGSHRLTYNLQLREILYGNAAPGRIAVPVMWDEPDSLGERLRQLPVNESVLVFLRKSPDGSYAFAWLDDPYVLVPWIGKEGLKAESPRTIVRDWANGVLAGDGAVRSRPKRITRYEASGTPPGASAGVARHNEELAVIQALGAIERLSLRGEVQVGQMAKHLGGRRGLDAFAVNASSAWARIDPRGYVAFVEGQWNTPGYTLQDQANLLYPFLSFFRGTPEEKLDRYRALLGSNLPQVRRFALEQGGLTLPVDAYGRLLILAREKGVSPQEKYRVMYDIYGIIHANLGERPFTFPAVKLYNTDRDKYLREWDDWLDAHGDDVGERLIAQPETTTPAP